MATQQDVIKKFMESLDKTTLSGTAALDEAIKACSNFNSIQEVIDKMISDCKSVGNGKNFLLNYCGINLDNDDTGAITGFDAGGSFVKDAEDIVPETGELIKFTGNSFTVNGLTLQLSGNRKFSDLTDSQKYIWQGLYTWWAKGALDLIAESYGNNFSFGSNSSAGTKKIYIGFYDNNYDSLSAAQTIAISRQGEDDDTCSIAIGINEDYYKDIDTQNPNGSGDLYLDRNLAHEFTHAVMYANIDTWDLPRFIEEGMAELTHGADDYRRSYILIFANSPLTLENTFNGSNGFGDLYAAGYMLLRYLAKQAADEDAFTVNTVSSTVLTGTSSNDKIKNSGNCVTVYSSSGNDVIGNEDADYSYIDAGTGNDYIYNESDYVTIFGGAGNDTIKDNGNWDTIYGEGGDDLFVKIFGTIYGGAGNDTFLGWKYGGGGLLYGDDGNDLFIRAGGTIDGGAGNDTINVLDRDGSINGGEGNDLIVVKYTNDTSKKYIETISGGLGNDTIDASNEKPVWRLYQYAQGDGKDVIIGFNSFDTLEMASGTYSTTKSGNNLIVNVDGGSIILKDIYANNYTKVHIKDAAGNIVTLNDWSIMSGTSGADKFYNTEDNVTISGLNGNDTITNYGTKVSISGGAGDDSIISSSSGQKVTIEAGNGNDYISGGSLVYGSFGDDTILGNDTIYGGDGNDYISGGNRKITFVDGGTGNDSINAAVGLKSLLIGGTGDDLFKLQMWINTTYDFGQETTINGGTGNDTIEIYSGGLNEYLAKHNPEYSYRSIYQYSSGDGNDIVEGVTGYDKISITGGSYSTIVSGNDIIVRVGNGSITLKDAKDIEELNIDGTFDSTSGGNNFSETLPAGISIKSSILTASKKFSGNEINLRDYLNVTKVNSAALSKAVSIVGSATNNSIKGGKGADTISGGGGNDTLIGGKGNDIFIYSSGNDLITDYKAGEDKISANYSTSTVKGSDVILTTANGNLTLKGAKDKVISFTDGSEKIFFADISYAPLDTGLTYDSKKTLLTASNKFASTEINLENYLSTVQKVNASALSKNVSIFGNDSNNSIKGGKGADTVSGGSGNDTLTGGTGKDIFIYSSGNDIITDYKTGEDKISVNYSTSTVKGSDVILTTADGNLTVKGAKDKVISFTDGSEKIFFAGTSYAPLDTGLTYDAKRTLLTASNKFSGNEINLENYLSTVQKVNASALSKAVSITGNDLNNSIKGGKGADTISGGSGNDTLIGGKGADIFIYSSGNDIITDYKAGEDKISANYSTSTVKGSDVILTTADGNLTLKGAKDKVITFTDGSEKIFFAGTSYAPLATGLTYDAKRTLLTASNKFSGNEINLENYLSTVQKVNASALSKAVSITGNDLNNSIKGGKGADTISGGSGNDTLFGGKGADTFVYSAGKDIITDYAAGDTIKINGTISKTSYSGKNVIFEIGNGSLTVKNGKGKNISITDSSGVNARTLDILEDNNFISTETQLSQITQQKFSVTQIQTFDNEDPFKPNITFGETRQ